MFREADGLDVLESLSRGTLVKFPYIYELRKNIIDLLHSF